MDIHGYIFLTCVDLFIGLVACQTWAQRLLFGMILHHCDPFIFYTLTLTQKSSNIIFTFLFWWMMVWVIICSQVFTIQYGQLNVFHRCSWRWTHHEAIIMAVLYYQNDYLFTFYFNVQTLNMKWLCIHMFANSNIYINGLLAMLGTLVMCTVYTNKCTFDQLKLRVGL